MNTQTKFTRPLKFALVGCGRIASRHSELLGGDQVQGATLVSVCDIDIVKAATLGERWGVSWYQDLHAMMQNEDIDVVVILTESGNHFSNVMELVKYKKHIVVEKPMALTLDDADQMNAACFNAGIRLFVIKQNRFNNPVVLARKAIEVGRLGKLIIGTVRVRWCRLQSYYDQAKWRGTWSKDGGVLANQASHHIDMLLWMMGKVESVMAYGSTSMVNIEAEDTAVAIIKFASGALGVVEATTATRPRDLEGSISLLGEKGTIEIGGFAVNEMKTWDFIAQENGDLDVKGLYSTNPPNVYGFGHKAYYEGVVKSLLSGGDFAVDGISGRDSLELIVAIYEAIATGEEVRFPIKGPLKTKLGIQ